MVGTVCTMYSTVAIYMYSNHTCDSSDLQYCWEVNVVADCISADGRPRLFPEGLGCVKKPAGMVAISN